MNLSDFPFEVLFNILLNSEPKDIANYCQTSKRASEICKDSDFWRAKLWRDYGQEKQAKGMTLQEQYQFKQIKVINSPISSGGAYYGIIDDQGDLYMAGYNKLGQLGDGTKRIRTNLEKVNLKSKVISVTTGLYSNSGGSATTAVVTVDGEVYIWGTRKSILVPQQLGFPRPGKIVKFVFESSYTFRKGIIMDNGSAYLTSSSDEIILIPAKTKIVDLIIPMARPDGTKVECFFLDNYGDVFFFHILDRDKKIMIKLDFPDPIRQLSISSEDSYFALSIKGEVYSWGHRDFFGTNSRDPISTFQGIIGGIIYIFKADIPAFVVSISSGNDNVSAVTSKGTVYVWGFNYEHRLVSEDEERKLLSSGKMERHTPSGDYREKPFIRLPLELKLKSKIKLISVGSIFTIALTEDGVMNYWGDQLLTPRNTI